MSILFSQGKANNENDPHQLTRVVFLFFEVRFILQSRCLHKLIPEEKVPCLPVYNTILSILIPLLVPRPEQDWMCQSLPRNYDCNTICTVQPDTGASDLRSCH